MRARLGIALIAVSLGCEEGPGKAWLVDRTRILGARVSAEREPARASIAPGETAQVDWLLASPAAPPGLSWSFAACVAPDGNYAAPRCDGIVLARGFGTATDGSEAVRMNVALPEAVPEAAREVLLLAAFCPSAATALDAATFTATCEGGVEPLLASAAIRLLSAGANRNPEIGEDVISLGGVVLRPATLRPSGAPCAPSLDAPRVEAGGPEQVIAFRFRGSEREDGESLDLSHVVTAGEFARQRSALAPDEATPRDVTVAWTPPPLDEVGQEGRLVEMFFVLRDGRGGAAHARRTICVTRE